MYPPQRQGHLLSSFPPMYPAWEHGQCLIHGRFWAILVDWEKKRNRDESAAAWHDSALQGCNLQIRWLCGSLCQVFTQRFCGHVCVCVKYIFLFSLNKLIKDLEGPPNSPSSSFQELPISWFWSSTQAIFGSRVGWTTASKDVRS